MKFSRGKYRVLVRRREGRLKPSWENNIKIDIQEVGLDGRDWIELHDLYSSNREE
jgi:hypothetical protein